MLISEQKKRESDEIDRDAIAHRLKQDVVSVLSLVAAKLCSKGALVPQATIFFLWVTRSTGFFHISFMLDALDLMVWNLWAPCNFS